MDEITISAARNGLSRLIAQAQARREPVTITDHGRPAAHLVPINDKEPVPLSEWSAGLAELWSRSTVAAAVEGTTAATQFACALGASTKALWEAVAKLEKYG